MSKRLVLTADEVSAFDELSQEHSDVFEINEEHILDQSLLLMIHDS